MHVADRPVSLVNLYSAGSATERTPISRRAPRARATVANPILRRPAHSSRIRKPSPVSLLVMYEQVLL